MNIVKIFNEMELDLPIKDSPVYFLMFKEMYFEGYRLYTGGYEKLFNKQFLNQYFESEIELEEISIPKKVTTYEFPEFNELFPKISTRMKEIRGLSEPVMTPDRKLILETILKSSNTFISIPSLGKSLHKRELITLLYITEWECFFETIMGWGQDYTSLTFKINSIYDIEELEIFLPPSEMEQLIKDYSYHDVETGIRVLENLENGNMYSVQESIAILDRIENRSKY